MALEPSPEEGLEEVRRWVGRLHPVDGIDTLYDVEADSVRGPGYIDHLPVFPRTKRYFDALLAHIDGQAEQLRRTEAELKRAQDAMARWEIQLEAVETRLANNLDRMQRSWLLRLWRRWRWIR